MHRELEAAVEVAHLVYRHPCIQTSPVYELTRLDTKVYLGIYDSREVSLEHLLLSWNPSQSLSSVTRIGQDTFMSQLSEPVAYVSYVWIQVNAARNYCPLPVVNVPSVTRANKARTRSVDELTKTQSVGGSSWLALLCPGDSGRQETFLAGSCPFSHPSI